MSSVSSLCAALSECEDTYAADDAMTTIRWKEVERREKSLQRQTKLRWKKEQRLNKITDSSNQNGESNEKKYFDQNDADIVKDALMRHFVEFGSLSRQLVHSDSIIQSSTTPPSSLSSPSTSNQTHLFPFAISEIAQTKSLSPHVVSLFNQSPQRIQNKLFGCDVAFYRPQWPRRAHFERALHPTE